jgi:hypothetical protein
MIIRLLIVEHELEPDILDLVRELGISGFGHDIEPIVPTNTSDAYLKLDGADMAIIDIGDNDGWHLAIAATSLHRIPTIVTSSLFVHQSIRDSEEFCFLSKPKYNQKKLRRKLEEFAELVASKKVFAI